MTKKIYFVTTNQYKFGQFLSVVKQSQFSHFSFEQLAKETVEIQANDNEQVALFSSQWACEKYNLPVIKEDVGFYIDALKGFPGSYISQIEDQIGTSGYLKLLDGNSNRRAYWRYSVAICFPGKQPVAFSTLQRGTIAAKAMGEAGWHTDKIFIPSGQKKTVSELLDENAYERDNKHYEKLLEYLAQLD